MEKYSRHRSRNFSNFDRILLLDIITKSIHIVENKKTDTANVKIKHETWKKITLEFNAKAQSGYRTPKQLHALYDCMKKKVRKFLIKDKDGLMTTKTSKDHSIAELDVMGQRIISLLQKLYDLAQNKHGWIEIEKNETNERNYERSVSDLGCINTPDKQEDENFFRTKTESINNSLQLQSEELSDLDAYEFVVSPPISPRSQCDYDISRNIDKKRKDFQDEHGKHIKIEILRLEKRIKEAELQQKQEFIQQTRLLYQMDIKNKEIENEILLEKLNLLRQSKK